MTYGRDHDYSTDPRFGRVTDLGDAHPMSYAGLAQREPRLGQLLAAARSARQRGVTSAGARDVFSERAAALAGPRRVGAFDRLLSSPEALREVRACVLRELGVAMRRDGDRG